MRAAATNGIVLSTSQVATALHCSENLVKQLMDLGEFPGAFRHRANRRYPIEGVRAYCERHGLPVPAEFDRRPATTLLAVGVRPADLTRLILAAPEVSVWPAATVFEAGRVTARLRALHAAVLDARDQPRALVLEVGRELRASAGPRLRLLGIAAEDDPSVAGWADAGFDTVYTPASYAGLVDRLAADVREVQAW
jgi:hypothetical protein